MPHHEQKSPHKQAGDLVTKGEKMSIIHRIKAWALRYYEAAVAVILLVSLCILLGYWYDVKFVPGGQPIDLYLALTILLAGLLSTRLFRLVLRFKTLRYIAAYPSVSAVIVVILAGAVYCIPLLRSNRQVVLFAVSVFGAAIVARELWEWVRRLLTSSKPAAKDKTAWAGWPVDLHWILDEKPIETVSEDHFGYNSLVSRLASMVEQNTCQSF